MKVIPTIFKYISSVKLIFLVKTAFKNGFVPKGPADNFTKHHSSVNP